VGVCSSRVRVVQRCIELGVFGRQQRFGQGFCIDACRGSGEATWDGKGEWMRDRVYWQLPVKEVKGLA
jgi:hypothetical protein